MDYGGVFGSEAVGCEICPVQEVCMVGDVIMLVGRESDQRGVFYSGAHCPEIEVHKTLKNGL